MFAGRFTHINGEMECTSFLLASLLVSATTLLTKKLVIGKISFGS